MEYQPKHRGVPRHCSKCGMSEHWHTGRNLHPFVPYGPLVLELPGQPKHQATELQAMALQMRTAVRVVREAERLAAVHDLTSRRIRSTGQEH